MAALTVESYVAAVCCGFVFGEARGAAFAFLFVYLGRLFCRLVFD